ncbi:hypothetical protein [Paucisalibacillus globulus]|uniref:hypothetical protein n=1 Tax=Paucisalibacillus globulus TaxID=351095 RepID=UPI0015968392|nr:hypothetical protein [Paucisalibacillus globulus]
MNTRFVGYSDTQHELEAYYYSVAEEVSWNITNSWLQASSNCFYAFSYYVKMYENA